MSTRRRSAIAACWLAAGLASGCASAGSEGATPAAAAPPSEGALYTEAQAQRGQQVFNTVCSVCHGTSEFRGRMFEITWMAEPVGNFFQHISNAMPQDRPGSLTPEEYASVVAYVLQLNGRPAGSRPLPPDAAALAQIRW